MQTWARRGLQTALVTGGLLMLGTGIASADEDVNPDRPASPLDGSVNVPVHIDNNVLGTPLGQKALPGYHKDVRVSPTELTGAAPVAQRATTATDPVVTNATGTVAPVVDKVSDTVTPIAGQSRDQVAPLAAKTKPVTDKVAALPGGDKLPKLPTMDKVAVPGVDALSGRPAAGNEINLDLVVPVDISGNAIAVLGHAETTNDSAHSYASDDDVVTRGTGGFISGNVVDLDWALPVQVTNNAVAGLGTASAEGTSSQEASATGDIVTDGAHSFLGGNVVAPQFATPVQVDGNAIAGGGKADAYSEADTSAESGGFILTSGADSAGGGNAVPVPVAVPVKANGNAIMGLGKSVAEAYSTADATAGATRTGMYGVPTYVETNGDPALAAGNIAQPAAAGPVALCGNAGGVAGAADATCDTATEAVAGGTSRTTGEGSILSGAIAAAPVALPVQGFGNAATAVGAATADATSTVDATSGGSSYTRGHDSVLSGTTANTPVSGPVEVFANAAAAVGDSSATAVNEVTSTSGGNTGTTGDNSAGGGNMATVPVTIPGEVFGNAAAGAGGADATAAETKKSTSGGGNNTDDDYGLAASNLLTVPVATAAQAFGNGAGAVAVTDAKAKADNELKAGGDSKATGIAGLLSGNIGQVPVSVPAQVFGTGASGLARGTQTAINHTDMESGGDAMSDGTHGTGSGNVVTAPVAGAAHLYGDSAAVLGLNDSLAGQVFETEAGGDTATSGADGLVAGNVVSPQALPLAQSFAVAASSLGGVNSALATNKTEAESGGDIVTNGDDGLISGNLVDVPAAAVVQPFGDAVAVLGSRSYASGLSNTEGEVGGTSTTSGDFGSLSGIDGTLPIGVNLPIYGVPVEVLAKAIAESANTSTVEVGEGEPQLALPASGGLESTEVPSILSRYQRSVPPPAPADPFQGVFSGVLGGFAGGMTELPGQDRALDVVDTVADGSLPTVPGDPHILPAPYPMDRSAADDPLGGLLTGTSAGPVGLDAVTGLLGNVDTNGVGPVTGADIGSVPVGGQRDLPVAGNLPVAGGLPGGLPVAGNLPVGLDTVTGLLGNVSGNGVGPVAGLTDLANLPVGAQRDLPVAGGLPVADGLPGGLPVDLLGNVPLVGGLTGGNLGLPGLNGLGGRSDVPEFAPVFGDLTEVTSVIPAAPERDLTDTTAVIPAVPAVDDPTDVTTIIPAVPGVGDGTEVPVVQTPSLNTLPVAPPQVSGVRAPVVSNVTPYLDESSLDSTRAALANLFTTHPIG